MINVVASRIRRYKISYSFIGKGAAPSGYNIILFSFRDCIEMGAVCFVVETVDRGDVERGRLRGWRLCRRRREADRQGDRTGVMTVLSYINIICHILKSRTITKSNVRPII